jgi:hypothetical protein
MVKNVNHSALKYNLVPKNRILYFDEEAHKYTDDLKTIYTSTTTIIGKYYEKFDKKSQDIATACERIGRNPSHPKYAWYQGKTAKQLLEEWSDETKRACDKGTKKHNYLENAVKSSNGYIRNANGFINGRIYTIDDIIKGHNFGRLSVNYFIKTGIDKLYPTIFSLIKELCDAGFKIYSEIGVYDLTLQVSGLVDILLVRGNEFIILDWKTNKAPIRFDAGYFEKNLDKTLNLNKWIPQDKYFYHPLSHLVDSIGNHYTLQLSVYDYLVETFGLKCIGNILCHIRTIEKPFMADDEEEQEEVSFLDIKYLKEEAIDMLNDHRSKNIKTSLF